MFQITCKKHSKYTCFPKCLFFAFLVFLERFWRSSWPSLGHHSPKQMSKMAQDRPNMAQDRPKTGQDELNMAQNRSTASQHRLKALQDGMDPFFERLLEASWSRLGRFLDRFGALMEARCSKFHLKKHSKHTCFPRCFFLLS